ncbi:hypothetical protein ACWEOE_18875 [Amycolatopsis sp. NPDC004368]
MRFGRTATSPRALPVPTRAEAEGLLGRAVGFVRGRDFDGLCRAGAQDEGMCRKLLERADVSHAAPSSVAPAVEGATSRPDAGNAQGAEVLSIRGTRADGSTYTSAFSAVRAVDGQVRSQNTVYWFSTFAESSS